MNDFLRAYEKIESDRHRIQRDHRIPFRIWSTAGEIAIPEPPDINQEWFRLKNAMNNSQTPSRSHHLIPWALALTTILVTAILIGFSVSTTTSTKYTTQRGQRLSLNLPDRSLVLLNAATHLSFSDGFNKDNRTVQLKGEAFFEVEHGDHPFLIHTEAADIEVVGTKFNVFARGGLTRIGVIDGIVRVTARTGEVQLLKQGQTVQCSASGFATNKPQTISYQSFPAWPKDQLLCNERSLASVIREVERRYDIEIMLDRPDLAPIPINGLLQAQDLEQLLGSLCTMVGADWERSGNTYIIR